MVDRVPGQFLTPPEVAKLWRVRRETVLAWIKSGHLRAINVAEPCRRPRYRIDPIDLAAFKERRTVAHRQPPQRRNGRSDITEFY
ncbi:MAG: helix-turn-helix domain-containing protein [Pirellulales bacterium]|nr:helix-turn-helix domain-containing protein [Pirellulales bacterium]